MTALETRPTKTKADGFAKLVVCVQAFVSHIGFSPVYLLLDTS